MDRLYNWLSRWSQGQVGWWMWSTCWVRFGYAGKVYKGLFSPIEKHFVTFYDLGSPIVVLFRSIQLPNNRVGAKKIHHHNKSGDKKSWIFMTSFPAWIYVVQRQKVMDATQWKTTESHMKHFLWMPINTKGTCIMRRKNDWNDQIIQEMEMNASLVYTVIQTHTQYSV